MAVFLVRAFSHRVARFTSNDPQPTPRYSSDTAVTTVCGVICILCVVPPGADTMVTHEELIVFVFLIAYVACYIVTYACTKNATDPPIYNMITATLQLLVIRLYCGTHTPYNPVLLWAVSTRSMCKIRSQFSVASACTVLLDAVLLALMCAYGFETHFGYIFIAVGAAACTADLILHCRG